MQPMKPVDMLALAHELCHVPFVDPMPLGVPGARIDQVPAGNGDFSIGAPIEPHPALASYETKPRKDISMKPGDTVYDFDGREFNLIFEVSGYGYLVEPFYDCEDGCATGDAYVVKRVFSEPPSEKLDEKIAERKKQLDTVTIELNNAKRELEFGRKEREKEVAKLSEQNAALKRIGAFLDHDIVAYVRCQYGDVKITPLFNATCDADTSHRDLKLLSLYGSSNGDLSWKLNCYRDDSGGWEDVFPCTSLEEANAKAAECIALKVDEWRSGKCNIYTLGRTQIAAGELGIPFPQEAADAIRNATIKSAEATVAAKQKELEDAKDKLAVAKVDTYQRGKEDYEVTT